MKEIWKDSYRLQIGNSTILDRLQLLGIRQNKSLVIRLPKNIPRKLFGDFFRGYFDGDGCVYLGKTHPKDRKNPRWVFQCLLTSGSKAFLVDTQKYLKKIGVISGGFLRNKERGFDLNFSHRDNLALYKLMYNNEHNLYLRRKYIKFRRAIRTLYGSVV